jgi:adenosylcobinamide-GDP ribazoletransferase
MGLIKGFIMSLGMFSILPVPKNSWDEKSMPLVIPFLPLVGVFIGLIWYGLSFLLLTLSIPLMIQSVMILFMPFILNGFIHLDGYMDTADAVFSRRSLDEKKRILKDPHTGAFAVIAVVSLFLFQFSAVYSMIDIQKNLLQFIFIPVISRSIACFAVLHLKPVFETGYAASFKSGKKPGYTVFICILMLTCFSAAWALLGLAMLSLLTGAIAGLLTMWYLCKQFKGISGDLSGCIITISELAALLCVALLLWL